MILELCIDTVRELFPETIRCVTLISSSNRGHWVFSLQTWEFFPTNHDVFLESNIRNISHH